MGYNYINSKLHLEVMYHKEMESEIEKKKQRREIIFPSKQKAKTGLQGRKINTGHANAYNHCQKREKKF